MGPQLGTPLAPMRSYAAGGSAGWQGGGGTQGASALGSLQWWSGSGPAIQSRGESLRGGKSEAKIASTFWPVAAGSVVGEPASGSGGMGSTR